jgi:cyclopropane fatty-acyl-phospholipid synthase-like methyltransferase
MAKFYAGLTVESTISYRGEQPPASAIAPREQANVPIEVSAFSDLLRKKNLRCVLLLGDERFIVGDRGRDIDPYDTPVIKFASRPDFVEFSKSFRLIHFGRLFVGGRVDGNVFDERVVEIAMALEDVGMSFREKVAAKIVPYIKGLLSSLGWPGSSPYNLDPRLYERFLDPYMQYTCGWYQNENDDLETAQRNKLRIISKQLRLTTGTRHLDIGCGWGGAIRYFTEENGTCSVGITDSLKQAKYARDMLARYTGGSKEIHHVDFFRFHPRQRFDAITIVGMLEHVDVAWQKKFFRRVRDSLVEGGRVYLQCITKSKNWMGGDGTRFLNEHVFPGHCLDTFEGICDRARAVGFAVEPLYPGAVRRDASSPDFAEHYAQTIRQWLRNLEPAEHELKQKRVIAEQDFRRLAGYLAVAAKLFAGGRGSLHRMILTKQ